MLKIIWAYYYYFFKIQFIQTYFQFNFLNDSKTVIFLPTGPKIKHHVKKGQTII